MKDNIEFLDIINRCCLLDPKAQETLYKTYYGYAMSIALRYSDSRDDAVEILNDSFLKVFKNIKEFIKEKSFKTWLRRIIINTSIDKFRSKKNTQSHEIYDINKNENSQFSEDLFDNLVADDLIKIIQQLPDIYRIVFSLYEIEGYSHDEISDKLGINKSTSRSNLSRAKNKLRTLLKESYNYENAG